MKRALACPPLLFVLTLFASGGVTHAEELIGQRLTLTGQWTGSVFTVTREQRWETKQQDPQRSRVMGRITEGEVTARILRIGPILIEWNESTSLEDLTPADLLPGRAVEAAGKLIGPAYLLATSIKTAAAEPGSVRLRGTVTEGERHPDGSLRLVVLGVPVEVPQSTTSRNRSLIRHPGERRPEEQFSLMVWKRPLTIGGRLRNDARFRGDYKLRDGAKDDVFRLDQELQIEILYPFTEDLVLFLKGEAFYKDELYAEDGRPTLDWAVRQREHWLYIGNVLESGFSLQLGRQNFREDRLWWWYSVLDAVRLHYDHQRFHAEFSLARNVAAVSTAGKNPNDPERDNALRLLGYTAWEWSKDQRLDTFFLYQNDGSRREVEKRQRSQGRLFWIGTRASGRHDLTRFGRLDYRIEGAHVGGHEVLFTRSGKRLHSRSVTGWAFENELTWRTRLPGRPALTAGYAWGSGEPSPLHGTDHAFRQTGLQDNRDRFRGVNRFHYYGEVLRPELSNLHLWTVAVGFRFWESSSIEFIYHLYRQVRPAPFLRNTSLRVDPEGKHTAIGNEWDLVIGFREWEHIDIDLIGALFRAGSAYGPLAGAIAYSIALRIDYNF